MGDFNADGFVNSADFIVSRASEGATGLTPYTGADGSGDGTVGPDDYNIWREHFGATVPVAPGVGSGEVARSSESLANGEQLVASSPATAGRLSAVYPLNFSTSPASTKAKLLRQAGSVQSPSRDFALAAWPAIPLSNTEFTSGDHAFASPRQRLADSENYVDAVFATLSNTSTI